MRDEAEKASLAMKLKRACAGFAAEAGCRLRKAVYGKGQKVRQVPRNCMAHSMAMCRGAASVPLQSRKMWKMSA